MKVIYNKLIPVKGFSAMNLFGLIFARKEYKPLKNSTLNHEAIHTAQMKELLYIPFYIIYGLEYLYNLILCGNAKQAYRNIDFEVEAYAHEYDLNYLNNRKHYAQWR